MRKYFYLLKDWKFNFKLVSFVLISLLILFGLIWGCFIDYWYVSPIDSSITYPRLYNFNVIASFWSVHTNILIMLWFFYALIYHNREEKNKFTNLTAQTSITVYITITFLLFWGIIVGNILKISEYDFATRTKSDIAITSLTHSLTPLLMIIYYFLSMGKRKLLYRTFLLKNIFLMLSYPFGYCIFLVLRAQLVSGDKIPDFVYPYGFLDFSKPLFGTSVGLSNFVCIFTLTALLILFNLLYIALNNFKFKLNVRKIYLLKQRNYDQKVQPLSSENLELLKKLI